MMQVN